MKFLIIGFLSMIFAGTIFAQSGNWKLTRVESPDKSLAGFIYHTESVGIQTIDGRNTKVVTGLRLVCSVVEQKADSPVIAIYWNTMMGNSPQMLTVRVDGKAVELGQSQRWNQDGQLLFRPLNESRGLVQALKTGRSVSFEWSTPNDSKRQTVFNLQDFISDLAKFNASCKTQI